VTSAMWKPIRNLSGALTGLPVNTVNRVLNVSGWVTSALPSSRRPFSTGTPTPAGAVGPLAVPVDSSLQNQLVVTHEPSAGIQLLQLVHDRTPAASTTLDRNYNSTLFQWVGNPVFDVGTRRLTWPFFTPTGTTLTTPTFFAATVTYSHDPNMSTIWRIVGDASRITTTGAQQSITYPDIPGTRTFEPIAADMVANTETITLFGVEPAAANAVREILEPEGADFGYFKIPALRHMTVSIGQ
jgi:hypothetical protein